MLEYPWVCSCQEISTTTRDVSEGDAPLSGEPRAERWLVCVFSARRAAPRSLYGRVSLPVKRLSRHLPGSGSQETPEGFRRVIRGTRSAVSCRRAAQSLTVGPIRVERHGHR